MKVEVLGTGCRNCAELYARAERAIRDSGLVADLATNDRLDEIASYGVVFTPALVIDGEVVSAGKLPTVERIAGWLRTRSGQDP